MLKYIKRIGALHNICTLRELIFIVYHFFITKKLYEKNIQLQRILIFVLACTDKNYKISLLDKNIIKIQGLGKDKSHSFVVRKYTRDILVFDGFFLTDDYAPFIEHIQKKNNTINLIIDAGANIGCSAIFFHQYFPDATIICIEPEQTNTEILNKNILINKAENKIKILNKALWNTVTTLELRRIDFSNDGFHVMKDGITDGIIDNVLTCTIPEILEESKQSQIDLLKIDIEGAEKVLFQDNAHLALFLNNTKNIIMEVHEEYITAEPIIDILEEFGFASKKVVITGQPTAIIAYK